MRTPGVMPSSAANAVGKLVSNPSRWRPRSETKPASGAFSGGLRVVKRHVALTFASPRCPVGRNRIVTDVPTVATAHTRVRVAVVMKRGSIPNPTLDTPGKGVLRHVSVTSWPATPLVTWAVDDAISGAVRIRALHPAESSTRMTRLAATAIARPAPCSPPPRRSTAAPPSSASKRSASQTLLVAVAGSGPMRRS